MLNTSNILLLLKEKYIFPKISCIFSNSLSYLKVFNDDHNSVTDETPNSQPDTINSEDSSNNDEPNLSDHSNEMSKLLEFELNREEWTLFKYVEEILRSFSEAIKLVSGKKHSTIGFVYFAIANIKEYLEERSGNNEIDKLKNCSENDFDQYELLKGCNGDDLSFTVPPLETGETVERCTVGPGPGVTGASVDRDPVGPVNRAPVGAMKRWTGTQWERWNGV
ncbi:unnamed protein product [Rotaria socialis]|uniref:Uncharacterized protein n=1 Tax=Rotaria socialis TaxID=392032 RepID=A0A818C4T7_9BILA|nr:unnamed protein product [Rotaria socialis]